MTLNEMNIDNDAKSGMNQVREEEKGSGYCVVNIVVIITDAVRCVHIVDATGRPIPIGIRKRAIWRYNRLSR